MWQPFCEEDRDKHGVARTATRRGGIGIIRKEENRRLKSGKKRKSVNQITKKEKQGRRK
jgi:hypothetical protein